MEWHDSFRMIKGTSNGRGHRGVDRLAVLASCLGWTLWLAAGDQPSLFAKGPYLQGVGQDTVTVVWESASNFPAKVRFGLQPKLDQSVDAPKPRKLEGVSPVSVTAALVARAAGALQSKTNTTVYRTNTFYVYETTLSGLQPGASYSYAVSVAGIQSSPRQFRTFSSNPDRVRFLVYGDSRSNPRRHETLAKRFRAQAPDFILHTGDLVANGKNYSLWEKEFFKPLSGVLDEVPFFPTIGNHEADATNYLAYFHLPGAERWYSFDLGPVHVLVLDYHFEQASSEQFRFASQDLRRSRAPWKIVVLHYPVFNLGGHATTWGHQSYLPLFHETKVDLVLAGHSHIYERFRPVAPRARANAWPITCITTGGGGASLYPSFDHPALVVRSTAHHFVVFDATADTLKGRASLAGGEILDRFELKKINGQLAADYLAQVYPEELLQLVYEVAPSLGGKAASLPAPHAVADVMLSLTPRKNSTHPAELDITLAPDSASYYTIENGPLKVTTPPPGTTNEVAWVKVRATGKKRISKANNGELSPALIFQARVSAPEGETYSRGAKAKLSDAAAVQAKKLARGSAR